MHKRQRTVLGAQNTQELLPIIIIKKKYVFCDHVCLTTELTDQYDKDPQIQAFPNPLEHLPADFGTLSPTNCSGSGVTISDLTPGFWLIM